VALFDPPADLDDWHVEGVLSRQALMLVRATEGVGKTNAVRQMRIRGLRNLEP
jgi:hypothetical protein